MSRAWWRYAPAVRAEVRCGDAVHHVLWRRANLVLEDHDVAAELVVDRLGGAPPECVRVLREWRDGARWAARLQPPGPGFRTRVPATGMPPALAARRTAASLHTLERSWGRRGDGGDEERRVHWFLRSAALPALRQSASTTRARHGWRPVPLDALEVRVARPGQAPVTLGRMWPGGARLRVALTSRWLAVVRDAGRALDAHGRFVVDITDRGPVVIDWRPQSDDLVPLIRHAAELEP